MSKGKYFTLFSNCIPVSGATNAVICDLQHGELITIPKELIPILEKVKTLEESKYNSIVDEDTLPLLKQYISYLEDQEFGFWTDHPEWFPKISEEWEFPALITNAIICTSSNNKEDLFDIVKQLNEHNCKSIEFRISGKTNNELIQYILSSTTDSGIQSIYLYIENLCDNNRYDDDFWLKLIQENPRLYNVACFNEDKNRAIVLEGNRVIDFKTISFSNKKCGAIDQKFFSVNINTYNESLHFNSCLNRKVSIDSEGNIKNCPSMKTSFGNIKDTTISDAIQKPEFKKYWNINKDKIQVCKSCEFRYICTDCRAYTEDPDNITSKPLKCGYDPFTGEWNEWTKIPLKQKSINFYDMREMIKELDSYSNG